MKSDVVIIGAGITGSTIARELSRYNLDITVVEKNSDVAFGSPTKANSGIIHAGFDDKPGTKKAMLCSKGNVLWHKIAPEVGAPFRENGSLVVAFKEEEVAVLKELKERGRKNLVPGLEIIDNREKLLKKEPNISHEAIAALYAPTAGITSPYELAIAMAESAKANQVKFLFDTKVTGLVFRERELEGVQTNKGLIKTSYAINAAGLQADIVSKMAGVDKFIIHPKKGEYCIFDNSLVNFVRQTLFPVPSHLGKGILVTSTVDDHILIGPNSTEVENKDDSATTSRGLSEIFSGALRLVPGLAEKKTQIISNFCGLRPESNVDDFIIESYDDAKGFVNAAGIKSPGLTSAPAVAQMVIDLLGNTGLELRKKEKFITSRIAIDRAVRNFTLKRVNQLIASDPKYGHVVCRCEHVTEGEIVEAIRRGATTLDGVKFRTRAGMGRCQSGFCTSHIIKILSRELGIPAESVTKRGKGTEILFCKTKQLLQGEKSD